LVFVHIIFFFFQAEDGIRDLIVTGVQTCALPISMRPSYRSPCRVGFGWIGTRRAPAASPCRAICTMAASRKTRAATLVSAAATRSEERRVGKSVDIGGRGDVEKKKKRERLDVRGE